MKEETITILKRKKERKKARKKEENEDEMNYNKGNLEE